jgi:hypothetical protein
VNVRTVCDWRGPLTATGSRTMERHCGAERSGRRGAERWPAEAGRAGWWEVGWGNCEVAGVSASKTILGGNGPNRPRHCPARTKGLTNDRF